jgi:hypothetical protein
MESEGPAAGDCGQTRMVQFLGRIQCGSPTLGQLALTALNAGCSGVMPVPAADGPKVRLTQSLLQFNYWS